MAEGREDGKKTAEQKRQDRRDSAKAGIGCFTLVAVVAGLIGIPNGWWQPAREAASAAWDSTGISCGRNISQAETDELQALWDDWAASDLSDEMDENAQERAQAVRDAAEVLDYTVVAEIPQTLEIDQAGEPQYVETEVSSAGEDLHLSMFLPESSQDGEAHSHWEAGVDLSDGSVDWHWTFEDTTPGFHGQHSGDFLVTTDHLTRGGTVFDTFNRTEVTAIDPSAGDMEGCTRLPGSRTARTVGDHTLLTPHRSFGTGTDIGDYRALNVEVLSLPEMNTAFADDLPHPPHLSYRREDDLADLQTRLLDGGILLTFDYPLSGGGGTSSALVAGHHPDSDFDTGQPPVRTYDLDDGEPAWTYGDPGDRIGVGRAAPGALNGEDGVVLARTGAFEEHEASDDPDRPWGHRPVTVEMLDSEGEVVWTYEAADHGTVGAMPETYGQVFDDVIVVPSDDDVLTALDAATGEELWDLDASYLEYDAEFRAENTFRIGDEILFNVLVDPDYVIDMETGENNTEVAEILDGHFFADVQNIGDHTVISTGESYIVLETA